MNASSGAKKKHGRPLKFHPPGVEFSGSPVSFVPVPPASSEVRRTPTHRLAGRSSLEGVTVGLLEAFQGCNGMFQFDKSLNPRRVLTKPSRPAFNNGCDNEKHDYILYVNDVIGNEEGRKYVILDLLGQGTFGQVVKCQRVKTGELVAVKVIKNQPAYFNQSMMEVTVLELLNGKHDPEDRHHIVRMRDTFVFRQHLCVVVELLSLNLYELIKQNQYRGFSLQLCRVFLAQMLDALRILKEAKIVHCDLKPENVLLKSLDSPGIKVIDYGSACHEQQTLYTYIQSRFYRSPEVLLGLPYSSAIDMWSLGCIAAELFLGLPLFPGASSYDQVSRMVETLGVPPAHMIELGRDAALYFDKRNGATRFALKSRERYAMETGRQEAPSKKYFASTQLEELILGYTIRPKDMPQAEREAEMRQRRVFVDFLRGLLKLNPLERWNPQQALQHPFITGKPAPQAAGMHQPIAQTTPSATSTGIPIQQRQRPRANTLSSLSLQDVPKQIAKVSQAGAGTGAAPRATAREPPTEQALNSAVEPPALPFETGNKPIVSPPSQKPAQISPTGNSKPPPFVVDRLASYAAGRRVSNPPGMMARGLMGRRLASRTDSLADDDNFFSGQPSSLPNIAPIAMDTAAASPRRSSRRASEPMADAAIVTNGPAIPAAMRRKGSGSSLAMPPSSLGRSLTMSDANMMMLDSEEPTTSLGGTSSSTTSASSACIMDTLAEVMTDEEQQPGDEEEDDVLCQMDIG